LAQVPEGTIVKK